MTYGAPNYGPDLQTFSNYELNQVDRYGVAPRTGYQDILNDPDFAGQFREAARDELQRREHDRAMWEAHQEWKEESELFGSSLDVSGSGGIGDSTNSLDTVSSIPDDPINHSAPLIGEDQVSSPPDYSDLFEKVPAGDNSGDYRLVFKPEVVEGVPESLEASDLQLEGSRKTGDPSDGPDWYSGSHKGFDSKSPDSDTSSSNTSSSSSSDTGHSGLIGWLAKIFG
ncbi:hypothetical protein [Haloarchaeobius amylolyticus]|uniref:hypothetical protein n=1 Tax=Haloarchaeobius amylolyticus TaxID=1198296 RepID=UPI0022718E7C|nr:hypothetical protein [Haloarchaeobius amylolyticus]